ncbi:hypothetical protein FB451DRAFT_439176 [Mycena latifolia]|nr:hypothetical protein FB451DRAFT_439176 [Mycena latifolia]
MQRMNGVVISPNSRGFVIPILSKFMEPPGRMGFTLRLFMEICVLLCLLPSPSSARPALLPVFRRTLNDRTCAFWIRLSSGRLCVELMAPSDFVLSPHLPSIEASLPRANTKCLHTIWSRRPRYSLL